MLLRYRFHEAADAANRIGSTGNNYDRFKVTERFAEELRQRTPPALPVIISLGVGGRD